MDIGVVDNISVKSLQIAQTTYILAIRDIARQNSHVAAILLRWTPEETRRLAETPVEKIEKAFHTLPPVLTILGQETIRGASALSSLLDAICNDDENMIALTSAHIQAFSNLGSFPTVATVENVDAIHSSRVNS